MRYLLDTNTCIVYLNGTNQNVLQRMRQENPQNIALCSVVKSELIYGAMKGQASQKTLAKLELFFQQFVSLPFDDTAAHTFGSVRADLARQGTPIGPYLQIAAIASTQGLAVITNNVREFQRVADLQVLDWQS